MKSLEQSVFLHAQLEEVRPCLFCGEAILVDLQV